MVGNVAVHDQWHSQVTALEGRVDYIDGALLDHGIE
jgi:hypothetical protein